MRAGRRVTGICTSPGTRLVRGAERVSSAVVRQAAHVRVVVGWAGRISRREEAQCPEAGVPADG